MRAAGPRAGEPAGPASAAACSIASSAANASGSSRRGTSSCIRSSASGAIGGPVGPVGDQRLVHICDGQDAHRLGEGVAGQPAGVAAAVETLVVGAGHHGHLAEDRDSPQDLLGQQRVVLNRRRSVSVSGPGLSRMRLEIDSLPRSCSSAARRSWRSAGSSKPIRSAIPMAIADTRSQCSRVHGDLASITSANPSAIRSRRVSSAVST